MRAADDGDDAGMAGTGGKTNVACSVNSHHFCAVNVKLPREGDVAFEAVPAALGIALNQITGPVEHKRIGFASALLGPKR